MATNIRLYKFTSGEEILADVKEDHSDFIVIGDAVTLIYRQQEAGKMSVGFAPYMPYAQGDITINKHSISASSDPVDDLKNEYNRIFGGIIVAPANDTLLKTK